MMESVAWENYKGKKHCYARGLEFYKVKAFWTLDLQQ